MHVLNIHAIASVFSWVGDVFSEKSLAAIGTLLMLYLGYIIKKEILPLLQIRRNREIAEHLLVIADDVTDYFRVKFPGAHWSVWLDKAVDKIIEVTGVGRDVAGRTARAAVSRKDGKAGASKS